MNSLKYFSRHELTGEQRNLLEKIATEQIWYCGYEDRWYNGQCRCGERNHPCGGFWRDGKAPEIEWISTPFNKVEEVVDSSSTQKIAGVFPAHFLFELFIHAQKNRIKLKVITFKFDRDRTGKDGQATVLALKSAIIYSISKNGILSQTEVLA